MTEGNVAAEGRIAHVSLEFSAVSEAVGFVAFAGNVARRGAEHQWNPAERTVHQIHSPVRRDRERQPGTVAEFDQP